MLHGKIYEARDCGKGWYALVDETGEEYAYPPNLFEVVDVEDCEPEPVIAQVN